MADKIKVHRIENVQVAELQNHTSNEKFVFLPDPIAAQKINEIIAEHNKLITIVADLIKEHGSKKYAVDDVFEIETDENGHDLQCSSGVGARCDCWKKEETPQWLEYHCIKCGCLYDDKATSPMSGRNGACKCDCGHESPK